MQIFDPSVLDVTWDDAYDFTESNDLSQEQPSSQPPTKTGRQQPFSQAILIIIDCHDLSLKSAVSYQVLFNSLEAFVRSRIKARENDRVGLVLHGSGRDNNEYSIKGLCKVFDLELLSCNTVTELRSLALMSMEEFQKRYQVLSESRSEVVCMSNALRYALREFRVRAPVTRFTRRLVIITCRDDPCHLVKHDSAVSIQLAQDLLQNSCLIDVIPLVAKFAWETFWYIIVKETYSLKQRQDTEDPELAFGSEVLRQQLIDQHPVEFTVKSISQLLQKTTSRQRSFQKTRLLISTEPECISIGVNVFVAVMPRRKPTGIVLRTEDRKPVKSDTHWLAESTGEKLSSKELLSYYELEGGEKLIMDKTESKAVRSGSTVDANGRKASFLSPKWRMKLLGFGPASGYDRHAHCLRDTVHFVCATDELVSGSQQFMSAMVQLLTLNNQYCYILWQYRAESTPRVFCGVPLWSESSLPGLYLLAVPFADEIRTPWLYHDYPETRSEGEEDKCWDEMLDLAMSSRDLSAVEDPTIAKFWHGIEVLALDEDNVESFEDETLSLATPEDADGAFGKLCETLQASLGILVKGAKRGGGAATKSSSSPAKKVGRRATGDEVLSYPEMTVVELKKLLSERGLKVTGKKDELIERLKVYDKSHA